MNIHILLTERGIERVSTELDPARAGIEQSDAAHLLYLIGKPLDDLSKAAKLAGDRITAKREKFERKRQEFMKVI